MAGSYNTMATVTVDSPVPYRLEELIQVAERDEVEQIVLPPSGKVVCPVPTAASCAG
jgi:hypothetical protein